MATSSDRANQQIDPEKMLRKNEDTHSSDDDQIACPSTQPLPRRGFMGNSSSPDPETHMPRLSSLSSSDINNDDTDDDPNYLSRSYGTPNPAHFRQNQRTDLSPRKEIAERNKTKLKKKRVMSTTVNTFSPMASPGPGSPFESPMITSITKGVRLPPQQGEELDREEYMLRREQQIDPEKQMMRRDHPLDDLRDDRPEAPSTGPLPRRAIPGGPVGLKPKALFLDDSEEDGESPESELTFQKEKVASTGTLNTASIEDREKRLTLLEQTLAAELEELRIFKQRLMEKEAELDAREKNLSASSPQ